ncbi:hypothetical protein RI367_006429 [Sorochytrium milnesiophthora]
MRSPTSSTSKSSSGAFIDLAASCLGVNNNHDDTVTNLVDILAADSSGVLEATLRRIHTHPHLTEQFRQHRFRKPIADTAHVCRTHAPSCPGKVNALVADLHKSFQSDSDDEVPLPGRSSSLPRTCPNSQSSWFEPHLSFIWNKEDEDYGKELW